MVFWLKYELGMPKIENFLQERNEKLKFAGRYQEVTTKRKGTFTSKTVQEIKERILVVGRNKYFSFIPGTKVIFLLFGCLFEGYIKLQIEESNQKLMAFLRGTKLIIGRNIRAK